MTLENISLGSGVYGRIGACLFLTSDAAIHVGVTTGIIWSHARPYWGKSEVEDMIWVTSSSLMLLSAFNSEIAPPFSSKVP